MVINLARATERRAAMAEMLDRLQLNYQFLDAVDGRMLDRRTLKLLYSVRLSYANCDRGLHPNEIGAALSHVAAWEGLVASGADRLLILEDDVTLDAEFPALLTSFEAWAPADWGIVHFAHHTGELAHLFPLGHPSAEHFSVGDFSTPALGSGGYMVRRDAAERLLEKVRPVRMAIDVLTGSEACSGVRIYGVLPTPVLYDFAVESTIWGTAQFQRFMEADRSSPRGIFYRFLNRVTFAFTHGVGLGV